MPSDSNPPPQYHWQPHNGELNPRMGSYGTTAAGGMVAWGVNQLWPSRGAGTGLPAAVGEHDQQSQLARHNDQPDPATLIANTPSPLDAKRAHYLEEHNLHAGEPDEGSTNTARRGLSVFRSWWGGGNNGSNENNSTSDIHDAAASAYRRNQQRQDSAHYEIPGGGEGLSEGIAPPRRGSEIYHKERSHFGYDLNKQMHNIEGKVESALLGTAGGGKDAENLAGRQQKSLSSRPICIPQRDSFTKCVDAHDGDAKSCQAQWDNYVMCHDRFPKSSI